MDACTVVDSRSGERFEAPEEYRRYAVQDPLGQKIGRVETLFVDGGGEPRYVRVKIGRFVPRSVLLRVGNVALDKTRRLLVLGAAHRV